MKLIQLFIQQVSDEYLLLDIVPGSEHFNACYHVLNNSV